MSYLAKPHRCLCLAVFSFPEYATVIKRPMDLQTMFYKVKLGAFGGLHPDDPAVAPPPSFEERKPPGLLVSPSGLRNVSESQESQRDRHQPTESAASASESVNALPIANGDVPVSSAVAQCNSVGSDVVDAFWSSDVIEGSGENSPVAGPSTGGDAVANFGSIDKDFGPNGVDVARETMSIKVVAGENGIPEVNGVPRDVMDSALRVGSDGIDQVYGGEGAGTAVSYSNVAGLSDESKQESSSTAANRGAEEGPVMAAGGAGAVVTGGGGGGAEDRAVWPPVAFETATAPFDYVAFFRDMKLVSVASGETLREVGFAVLLYRSCCVFTSRFMVYSGYKVCFLCPGGLCE